MLDPNVLEACNNVVPVRSADGTLKLAHVDGTGEFYSLVANTTELTSKDLSTHGDYNAAVPWVSVLFQTEEAMGELLNAVGLIRDPTVHADKLLSYERITDADAVLTYHLLLHAARITTLSAAAYPAEAVRGAQHFLELHAARSPATAGTATP